MKRYRKSLAFFLCLITLILFKTSVVSADELNFSVETKPPENQIDKTKTYFDLLVKPGEKEDLTVILKNTSDKETVVLVRANTAFTNDNGVIDYTSEKPVIDSTLTHPFSSIAKVDNEVVLAPKENKEIHVQIDVPKEPFNGMILGGLYFTQKSEDNKDESKSGVQIINKFGYTIGVMLRENEDEVPKDMKLLGVKAGQRNYRNVILANLQNPAPRMIGKITVDADVYAASNLETPVYHSKQENLEMAPNSNFNYGITMNNKAFKSGKYLLKMTVTSGDKEWKFEKEFEIKADEAKKFNDEAVELAEEPTDYTLWIILAVILLVLVIVGVVIWVIHSKRKHEAELVKAKGRKSGKTSKSSKKKSSSSSKKKK